MHQAKIGFRSNPRIPYALAGNRPPITAPRGKPIIVHFVLNVESWPFDKEMPRKVLSAPHGRDQIPDVPNFCWAEYGLRVGVTRILDLFKERSVSASVSINASVVDAYPACAEAILDAGWEFIGHGIHQASLQTADHERDLIARALEKLRRFSGQPVRGWLSPGLRESEQTPDLLAELGVDYLCDWNVDDLPVWMSTKARPLMAIPYSLELNDSVIYAVEKHRSDEMFSRLSLSLECLAGEVSPRAPRVLGIGLHPHLIGVPHRFVYLQRMLDALTARDDVCFMTGSAIVDWFTKETRQ